MYCSAFACTGTDDRTPDPLVEGRDKGRHRTGGESREVPLSRRRSAKTDAAAPFSSILLSLPILPGSLITEGKERKESRGGVDLWSSVRAL